MSWTKKGGLEGVREIGELMSLSDVLGECSAGVGIIPTTVLVLIGGERC